MQEKRPDYKDKVNFKIHDVTICYTNNCNTYLAQYLSFKVQFQSLAQFQSSIPYFLTWT